jgi:hypothetical protein
VNNRNLNRGIALVAVMFAACSAPPEPVVTPPQPVFVPNTSTPDPVDHGIYADAGPQNAIDIEWKRDSTGTTTGYLLYRSVGDSSVGSDGLLAHRTTIADIESSNQLISPLDTSYSDTLGITPGATYYYQLQAFYRSPTNAVTYSHPTHVGISTSFTYAQRILVLSPNGTDTLHGFPLQLLWQDPNNGGSYQIIVQRLDNLQYVWSGSDQDFESTVTIQYPMSATPIVPGVPYQWRVKWIEPFGGSTSTWLGFTVEP